MAERHRIWRRVDPDLFRFTTTDLRDVHVAVMGAVYESAVLAPALRFDQVRAALEASGWDEVLPDEVLERALSALVGWGLLEATQDHSAHYATPEEFERRNLQWSMTPRGEAAVTGLLHSLDVLAHAVGLQPAVLDAIGDRLNDLAELVGGSRTAEADARLHIRLVEIENHLAALVGSVRQFHGHLQRLVREDAARDEVFVEVKRRTVAYLDEYVDGVERPQLRLRLSIEQLEARGLAALFDRALAGANLAPIAGGDPGPAWLAERARRWAALHAWFAPSDGEAPLIAGLLDVARTAIVELLRVLEQRWDSRRRSASVSHDFRRLAALFAAAPGDDEAHLLFAAAFGMWPARHAHLTVPDGESRAPTLSWFHTEPVEVAPSLRTTGSLANRGRVRPVPDPAALRAQRRSEHADQLAAHLAVRSLLATRGPVRLSTFSRLPPELFAELLELLGLALDAPADGDGRRQAISADGRVEVVLRDLGDLPIAALHTSAGILRGPDFLVSIDVVGTRPAQEAAS